jgi:hypothetical protein
MVYSRAYSRRPREPTNPHKKIDWEAKKERKIWCILGCILGSIPGGHKDLQTLTKRETGKPRKRGKYGVFYGVF